MSYSTQTIIKRFLLVAILIYGAYFVNHRQLFGKWSGWVSVAVLLASAVVIRSELEPRVQGDVGEMDVDDELAKLPSNYRIIGSTNIARRGNVDNIVVGASGIWVIEVKSYRNFLARWLSKPLRQSWAEAFSVRDALKSELGKDYTVQPVVVYSDPRARIRFGLRKQRGVYVVGIRWLVKLILEHPTGPLLDTKAVEEIAQVLRQYRE